MGRVIASLALALLVVSVLTLGWIYSDTGQFDQRGASHSEKAASGAPSVGQGSPARPLIEAVSAPDQSRHANGRSTTARISFPDGDTRLTHLKARLPPWDIRADVPLKDQLEELRRAAGGGDDRAAEALYRALKECSMAYRNEQDLEPAVETLHQFELCEGITDADLAEIDEWRTLAVTRGNLFALQTHAASLGRTEAGLRVWESAWQAGDRLALEFLGVLYSKGVRPLPDGTPDRVSAYAHKYLNLEIQKAVTATPSQTRRMILAALENDLSREAGKLTPEQWEQAIALAKRLAENPNCCYVP